jgi:hypothetical protein
MSGHIVTATVVACPKPPPGLIRLNDCGTPPQTYPNRSRNQRSNASPSSSLANATSTTALR